MYNKTKIIYFESPTLKDKLTVNDAVVIATLNTGQGHSQLEKFSAILDMPCMSNTKYQKVHEFVVNKTEMILWESIVAAGKEEARTAIENGEVNSDGIPTLDKCRSKSKRSYKHNQNALSGVVSYYINSLSKMTN